MRKKIKCLSSIFLALVLMIATATIVSAVESRYSDTHSVLVGLSIYDTTAYCQVEVEAASGTTSIEDGQPMFRLMSLFSKSHLKISFCCRAKHQMWICQ